jgi:hypothetical protein
VGALWAWRTLVPVPRLTPLLLWRCVRGDPLPYTAGAPDQGTDRIGFPIRRSEDHFPNTMEPGPCPSRKFSTPAAQVPKKLEAVHCCGGGHCGASAAAQAAVNRHSSTPVRSPSRVCPRAGRPASVSMKVLGSGPLEAAGQDLNTGWQVARRKSWRKKVVSNGQGRPVHERLGPSGTPSQLTGAGHHGVAPSSLSNLFKRRAAVTAALLPTTVLPSVATLSTASPVFGLAPRLPPTARVPTQPPVPRRPS